MQYCENFKNWNYELNFMNINWDLSKKVKYGNVFILHHGKPVNTVLFLILIKHLEIKYSSK